MSNPKMYCESPTKKRKSNHSSDLTDSNEVSQILLRNQVLRPYTSSVFGKVKTVNVASNRALLSNPPIFKLNVDCCDEIFEYLTLKDLHALGKTCKGMQRVAGEYFERNYKGAEKLIHDDGVSTETKDVDKSIKTTAFNPFTKFISFYGQRRPLCYFKSYSDDFISVNHLYIAYMSLNNTKMKYFESILPTIETLQIRQCTMWREPSDLYEVLLKYCPNLKHLYIQEDFGYILNTRETCLIRNYPLLEHLELTPNNNTKMPHLKVFFELNANIQSFATSSHCIWDNRAELMELPTKLDSLDVKHLGHNFYFTEKNPVNMLAFIDLLNQLYDRGFYRRLHFYVPEVDQQLSEQLLTLRGLEKLTINQFTQCYALPALKQLKELNIFDCTNADQLEPMAIGLMNLERLLLQRVSNNDMLPFIRYSTKLKHLKILSVESSNFQGDVINLQKLNREREKLFGARKVMIYIEDNIFLATKWSTRYGDTDLKMIEMKRSNAICWDYDYSTVRTLH